MGYHTDLTGKFTLDRSLSSEHQAYLAAFSKTRRMARATRVTSKRPDPVREAVGLPLGGECCYYVGGEDEDPKPKKGESYLAACKRAGVRINKPPRKQPGLWCPWVPGVDGTALIWDEMEKPGEYVEWLKYLIANFLGPWGYKLNGEVRWHGQRDEDRGTIFVKNNRVEEVEDVISNPGPSWA